MPNQLCGSDYIVQSQYGLISYVVQTANSILSIGARSMPTIYFFGMALTDTLTLI